MAFALILVAKGRRHIIFCQVSQLLFELIQFLREALKFQLRQNVTLAGDSDLIVEVLVPLGFATDLQV